MQDNSGEEDALKLQLANRIFVGTVYSIKPDFLHTIRQHYFADAEQVNFAEMEATANKVNSWVQKATRNRIKDVIVPSNHFKLFSISLFTGVKFMSLMS